MSGPLRLVRVDGDPRPQGHPDGTLYQSPEWVRFLQASQGAEPVYARVLEDGRCVGALTSLVVRKAGLRMLGSPLPGWTTPYMGFTLDLGVSRMAALDALVRFASDDLGCVHLEVMDRHLDLEQARRSGLRFRVLHGFEIDLRQSQEQLLAAMSSACRRCLRKAERVGVTVEEAHDSGFVDDFYAQLTEVFGRQGLAPPYPRERVELLVQNVHPTGRLLLARARDADGRCIATGIFPAGDDSAYFWGGASLTEQRVLRPNEAVHWFAMQHWKARGVARYDMGGGGDYKRKYGGTEIAVPWLRWSRFPLLEVARTAAQTLQGVRQRGGLRRPHVPDGSWRQTCS